ncbi:hypothetical protein CLV24_12254 [Pontibacter ummariensis]|uniref:Uncharacterized protein n=1 Tax=Pontibacter ummariensis TaxID=1610492 RepID=A0A239JNL2_9BACT|nr:hypothetical protein [Pontibacter ummariensis]PRY07864.1 hypothetical protein CLV24_12254 [Pontibacter ummariensis]SNT06364.1 hypothetical protein SAMN06296052_12254 [Pontibacter ummariensis]
MELLDIRNLLENIERRVCQQEITTDTAITKLINTEIAKAINLMYQKEDIAGENVSEEVSSTTLESYLTHLKNVEAKLKKPSNISAQCTPVEERDINRRLLLILNRIKGYSRK